jgi:hypothetical protein
VRKLFIHVGPHKTGSTYIQKALLENREYLMSLGVTYPNVGLLGQYGHHEIVEKVKGLDRAALAAYLAQFLGGALTIISSENLDRLSLGEIQKLRNALTTLDPKLDVGVIYYYRNYMDLLPSWWQEEVKHGSTISFYEFALPHVWRPFSSHIVNPALVLDLFAEIFGKERIIVVDYDVAREKGNILHPILDLLGIDASVFNNEVVNASLGMESIEIIRALNAIAHANGEWHYHKMRALFLRKKKASAISGELDRLLASIREHMKPLHFEDGFFEKLVMDAFSTNYEQCLYNKTLGKYADRKVLVPSDTWMLSGDAVAGCERIYQHIISGDVSY